MMKLLQKVQHHVFDTQCSVRWTCSNPHPFDPNRWWANSDWFTPTEKITRIA